MNPPIKMKYALVGVVLGLIWVCVFYTDWLLGYQPRPSFRDLFYGACPYFYNGQVLIPLSKRRVLHVHHWVTAAVCALVVISVALCRGQEKLGDLATVAVGFFTVLFLEGLRYKDALIFVEPNPC